MSGSRERGLTCFLGDCGGESWPLVVEARWAPSIGTSASSMLWEVVSCSTSKAYIILLEASEVAMAWQGLRIGHAGAPLLRGWGALSLLSREREPVGASMVNALAEAQLDSKQACYLPISDGGSPAIENVPGIQGSSIAAGHSCRGILNGPGAETVIAELLTEGRAASADA
eukprot:jgi/Astpho2/7309/Aster-x1422